MHQRIAGAAQRGVVHQGQGFHWTVVGREHFVAAIGVDGLERQRVIALLAVAKSVWFHLEPAVDHIDHRFGRPVIDPQHVMPACGGAAGRQVAVDVGTAKAVDRLLRVTDQQQRSVLPVIGRAVDAVKDAELQRRGVLKLVNHGHRELLAQTLCQAFARIRIGQRHIQALQHVGKTKQTTALFELTATNT